MCKIFQNEKLSVAGNIAMAKVENVEINPSAIRLI